MKKPKIPGKEEWSGWEEDLDVRYAHRLLFGKSIVEVVQYFEHNSIERAGELLYMPRGAFQYYVLAFSEYLKSAQAAGDSDAASPFLRLLVAREKKDPGSVREIYELLKDTVRFVVDNQSHFDADENIYGKFSDCHAELVELMERGQNNA